MKKMLLCILFSGSLCWSQQNTYLISPNQEVIPLGNRRPGDIIARYSRSRGGFASSGCGNFVAGYDTIRHPMDQRVEFYHKEVCGQWYVAPADGTIDTVYYYVGDHVGPSPHPGPGEMDSTVFFRIFSSSISPWQGPGVRPGPYRPPCTSWGYFINTNDPERGIAAFAEDATPPNDSAWVPTNTIPPESDSLAAFPPSGHSIWGLEGYPVVSNKPNTTMKVVMRDLAPLYVHKGDVIFITFRIPDSNPALVDNTQDVPFEIGASDQNVPYPSRAWKFYEHDSATELSCGGISSSQVPKGWVARGSFSTDDSLAGTAYNIWYSMTATSNTPPVIAHVDQLHSTLSTDPRTVTCTIYDCDNGDSAASGVKDAWLSFSVNLGAMWSTTPLSYAGGDQFEGVLPGAQPGCTMEYRVVAEDSSGFADSSALYSYRVVTLDSPGWYRIDTTSPCSVSSISQSGTIIDTSQWFIAPRDFGGSVQPHRGDDGTAGPFSMSSGFVYFGDTMYYAWVGVNGAIALSKTAADTIDLNAGGFWTGNWDFPYAQHHSRSDTLHEQNMPKAFIAPYWANWITKNDSPLATFGKVRYLDDTNRFVVEWDSLGDFLAGSAVADIDVFRVILHKDDNSIEFQYDNVGTGGFDTMDLTGLQSDSNYHPQPPGQFPPYAFYNRNGYPSETHLHNNLCIHYEPVIGTFLTYDGWNVVSVPSIYPDYSLKYVFPDAIGPAFMYDSGYKPVWTLQNGTGYWVKFAGPQVRAFIGKPILQRDILVVRAWNIIGSISVPVPVGNLPMDPQTGIGPSTNLYTYTSLGGYQLSNVIMPGGGYWVRAAGSGYVHLAGSGTSKSEFTSAELNGFSKITISEKAGSAQTLYIGPGSFDPDKYLMPPPPPEGSLNVRFASDRLVEIYPPSLEANKKYEYPITVSGTHYPLTIYWDRGKEENVSMVLKSGGGDLLAVMNGQGKITLNDASVRTLILEVNEGVATPKFFALGRNYPNPFNPTTRFTVEIPRMSQVEISIYDILGRKIATLWNGEQMAGYHTMEWDGLDDEGMMVPTGIYFLRMNVPAENFSQAQKIMMMK